MPIQISEMSVNSTVSPTGPATATYDLRIRALEDKLASIFKPDGSIDVVVGGSRITVDRLGIHIKSASVIELNGVRVSVTASQVQVDSPMVQASGVVQCSTIIANSVVGASYTPGAGNVW